MWREIDQEEAMNRGWEPGEQRLLVRRSLSNEEARRAVARGNARARRRRRREQAVALVMMPWALAKALVQVAAARRAADELAEREIDGGGQ